MKGWLKLTAILFSEEVQTYLSFCAFSFNAAAFGIGNSRDKMPITNCMKTFKRHKVSILLKKEIIIYYGHKTYSDNI